MFTRGDLFGTTHACIGQEAVAVGVTQGLHQDDIITSNHRGHGHYIAFTGDVEGLLAELMGKKTGVCAGRSGSQHLCYKNFFSNGITGGMIPVATGMALAEKKKKSGKIVVCFLGDGALGEGPLYESLNMASLWGLPIIFVVENNSYAMSTHISEAVAGKILERGKAFSIKTEEFYTQDAGKIFSGFEKIISHVRTQVQPYFCLFHTYRFCGHSKSDDCCYRDKNEELEWRKKDPLLILEQRLEPQTVKRIQEKCRRQIEEALSQAAEAPFPDPACLSQGLWG